MAFGLFKNRKKAKVEKKLDRAASSKRTQGGGLRRKKTAQAELDKRGIKSTAQKEKEAKKATADKKRLEGAQERVKTATGRNKAAAKKTIARSTASTSTTTKSKPKSKSTSKPKSRSKMTALERRKAQRKLASDIYNRR